MTPSDRPVASSGSQRTIRLIGFLHIRKEPDGGAQVIDDRTFTTAHVNKAACIIMEALREPRTQPELAAVLADAADCDVNDAVPHTVRLVDELTALGWIESGSD